jgi:hypothetical protein
MPPTHPIQKSHKKSGLTRSILRPNDHAAEVDLACTANQSIDEQKRDRALSSKDLEGGAVAGVERCSKQAADLGSSE